ncbi:hypothetical protein P7C70_g2087, partial [Phenoliferia sp. Uapishka_3]
MPKTTDIGTAGEANKAIGGVPTIYYYDFMSRGRGEALRLFFEEAGIAFKDFRWSFDERNKEMNEHSRAKTNPVGSLPYLDLEGRILTQSYPTMRYLSAKLGKYDGKTLDEKYFVDQVCDLCLDWRTRFVDTAFVTDANGLNQNEDGSPFQKHKEFSMPKYVKGVEGQLAKSPYGGPFTLGETITYADIVLYQIYHDESKYGGIDDLLATDAPKIKALVAAVAARPNIKAYFASERYYD